jgi:hypothetical protein
VPPECGEFTVSLSTDEEPPARKTAKESGEVDHFFICMIFVQQTFDLPSLRASTYLIY